MKPYNAHFGTLQIFDNRASSNYALCKIHWVIFQTRLVDHFYHGTKMKETFELAGIFKEEMLELFSALESRLLELEREPVNSELVSGIFRALHTIKGNANMFGADLIENISHEFESCFDLVKKGKLAVSKELIDLALSASDYMRGVLKNYDIGDDERIVVPADSAPAMTIRNSLQELIAESGSRMQERGLATEIPGFGTGRPDKNRHEPASSSVRVASAKLDELISLAGELVTCQAQLMQTSRERQDTVFINLAERFDDLIGGLCEKAMGLRMLPIESIFFRFRRLVRDLAPAVGKKARLIFEGGDTELDKSLIEKLNDPLVHIIRNCIDHGIEAPDVRTAAGKSAEGTITLLASHNDGKVMIEIKDDGAGIDPGAIRKKALDMQLIAADEKLTDRELYSLLFTPGFSTADKITSVSGRGVGMDVVKKAVDSCRGSIEIASRRGKGTEISLRIPLTVAIIDGFLVRAGKQSYILPSADVEQFIEYDRQQYGAKRKHFISLRDKPVPVIRLRDVLRISGDPPDMEKVAVIRAGDCITGIVLDDVLSQTQAMIKPLGSLCTKQEFFSGATILGNGAIALILDAGKITEALAALHP